MARQGTLPVLTPRLQASGSTTRGPRDVYYTPVRCLPMIRPLHSSCLLRVEAHNRYLIVRLTLRVIHQMGTLCKSRRKPHLIYADFV
jgi:hypothetical protein